MKECNKEKYGVEYVGQRKDVIEKRKEALNSRSTEEVFNANEKRLSSIEDKYGANAWDIFRKKAANTNLLRYGVKNAMLDPVIARKAADTRKAAHGGMEPIQTKEGYEKWAAPQRAKNNGLLASQTDAHRKQLIESNINMSDERRKRASTSHRNRWSEKNQLPEEYMMAHENEQFVEQIYNEFGANRAADMCGVDVSSFYEILKQHNIELVHNIGGPSQPEKEIRSIIENFGLTVEPSNRTILDGYEIDIYIPEKNIGIEYHGLYWHSSKFVHDYTYHKRKQDIAESKGIRLIQIFEDEWLSRREVVSDRIKYMIGETDRQRVFARKCSLSKVSHEDVQCLYESNHIQGSVGATVHYGLMYENKLIAAMSLLDKGDGLWDLVRFCTSHDVVGGFSKLLKKFIRENKPTSIISFADRRWSSGGVYVANGFTEVMRTKPNYSYIKGKQRVRKEHYRHARMAVMDNFDYDPSLSETQNTEANNIYRIYDAGKLKYRMDCSSL
jgi:hypothetical protein